MDKSQAWWNDIVIYEIFPKTFSEKGFVGIEERLGYIKKLGIDAIWLCPIFMSPFFDAGYDISDYYQVNPMFGDMDQFISLIKRAHEHGIKIILDIALNHTSLEHHWFKRAKESKISRYRDYYIFAEGNGNQPPNNWVSSKTRKSTWSYNKLTKDYYLHIYTKYQADLNWANPDVRKQCYDILNYWSERGVDGFRLDVINKIGKPKNLNINSKEVFADYLYENHPYSHQYIHELNQQIKSANPDCFLLGQLGGVTKEQALLYAEKNRFELDSFLQFEHMDINALQDTKLRDWNLDEFKAIIMKWQQFTSNEIMGTHFLANHDSARSVNHFTNAIYKDYNKAAKMLCLFQLCLKGIQVIYMGDELGMTNVSYDHIDEFHDIRSKDIYENLMDRGVEIRDIIELLNEISRDNARQPFPFDAVEDNEVLAFYQWMIQYRKNSDLLKQGNVNLFYLGKDIFAYQRYDDYKAITVICNFTEQVKICQFNRYGSLIKSTDDAKLMMGLKPYEGRMYLGDL